MYNCYVVLFRIRPRVVKTKPSVLGTEKRIKRQVFQKVTIYFVVFLCYCFIYMNIGLICR
jgi:hypothetical protein